MRHTKVSAACLALALSAAAWAIQPPESGQSAIASKAFFKPELYLPIQNTPLATATRNMNAVSASRWDDFFARNGKDFRVYIDPRTGTPSSVEGSIPLIPGNGFRNNVDIDGVREAIGRSVADVDANVVGDLVLKFIADNQAAFNIDLMQLGEPRVTRINENLWQFHVGQVVNGVPVNHARIAATISHGNLILIGTESWANVDISTRPALSPDDALISGNGFVGMLTSPQQLWQAPELRIAPIAPQGESFAGAIGTGYAHHLVYVYGFQDPDAHQRWKVTVEAQTGEVLAVEDDNHYFESQITGGIYPSTNIETCADNTVCGTMQPNSPMPWANTGQASPANFTDGAGVFNYSTGATTTTLAGKYVRISDSCGAINVSNPLGGDLNMGGVNGHHDCTVPASTSTMTTSPGNTAAARSSFYELNKLAEQARGYLPTNTWLQSQLTANVNITSTCNAFWNGSTVNFYRSGGGCRNTGEIGAVFDHEWGHGLDDFDANGTLSNSSEGYADIAAIYRLQTSCVGYGFFHTSDRGCGPTPDGLSMNQNETQTGSPKWCNLRCSGVRDADWEASDDGAGNINPPATPQNFVCGRCSSGTGPCSRQVHCAASPARQAAWDLVKRDLPARHGYDDNTSFIVGNKLFYQGSGNVGAWHACNCTGGTSDGCGTTNGYMQWLAADDDNGNLADGTPHMQAIFDAFNRHNIACSTPSPATTGCAAGPSTAPSHTATAGDSQITLNWNTVAGASEYWVMKTEGFAGCNFGKVKVATVAGNSYTDQEVANGRPYCYSIVAASSNACYSPASACSCVTPACTPPGSTTLTTPTNGATGQELATVLDWADVTGASTYEVQVSTSPTFATIAASASSLVGSTWTVSPALAVNTTYYWRARANNSCGGVGAWSATSSFTTRGCITLAAPTLTTPADGATGVALGAVLDWADVTSAASYQVDVATDASFTNIVRTISGLTASTWTVTPALSNTTTYYWRARAADSCGTSANSATRSFTTTNICTPTVATFDTARQAPTCGNVCGCDTGTTLVNGRGTMSGGIEQNQPNTINDSCADGTSGTFHSDESIDRVVIKTVDNGPFAVGKQVTVEVTVWCWGSTDYFDLYYTTNAASPTWTALTTDQPCTSGSAARTFTHTFTLGATAGAHAIRPQFRYGGSASSCTAGSYNDRDDLVFTVGAAVASVESKQTTSQGRSAPAGR
ncbi:endopeptidase [Myxococcus stipitatus]|uniref:endopeptidase n=1 Tax=Myxococcus stipitatus TaxID=83455 RepID=UPI001F37DF3B|nr:endopeptidase [Myxococcus stipitatus]MCE9667141.1 endopeptidase [Myxococcus stipitatus]